jgi:hypothetical protein
MNQEDFEEFVRRASNRSYVNAFRHPEGHFDVKELMPDGGSMQVLNSDMLQPLRDPLRLFTDQVVIPPSYLIFKDDAGNVYAKNGRTGQIDFSGTDAASVIQSAINSLTTGGTIFIKGGEYVGDIEVKKSYIRLVGEGRATKIVGKILVGHRTGVGWLYYCGVENLWIYAAGKPYGLRVEGCDNSIFRNLIITANNDADGIQIGQVNDSGTGSFVNVFQDIWISGCLRGVNITSIANANKFYNITVGPPDLSDAVAFNIAHGSSNVFYSPFVEAGSKNNNPTAFYINGDRTVIYSPYIENVGVGFNIGSNAIETRIFGAVLFDVTTGMTGSTENVTQFNVRIVSGSNFSVVGNPVYLIYSGNNDNGLQIGNNITPWRRGIVTELGPQGGLFFYTSTNFYNARFEFRNSVNNNVWFRIYGGGCNTGSVIPFADNTYTLGSSSARWANVYAVTTTIGDLGFTNGWRITEDEKYGLILVSPSGKKYRFILDEVD